MSRSTRRIEERPGRPGRWRVDLGRDASQRFLFSYLGIPLDSRELAEAVATLLDAHLARGRALDDVVAEFGSGKGSATRIDDLLQRWVEDFRRKVEVERRQPRTLREYEKWAGEGGHIAFYWRDKTLAAVDAHAIEDWEYRLATERGLGPKSRRNILSGFRVFLTWVRKQRPGFVVPEISWPEVEEHQPAILDQATQAKVLDAIPWPKAGIFWCMALTLVRPSEARVLRVRDWVGAEIRVTRAAKDDKTRGGVVRGLKARRPKVVPLLVPLDLWLMEHVTDERRLQDPDGPLFLNPDGEEGGWWSKTALRRTWAAACAKVGVSGVSLYEGLKHSTATHLKAQGADDRMLAALAGHRDPRSIEKYARMSTATVLDALGRLRQRK